MLVSEVFLFFLLGINMDGLHTKSTKLLLVFVVPSTVLHRADGFGSSLLKYSPEGRTLGLLKISEKGMSV